MHPTSARYKQKTQGHATRLDPVEKGNNPKFHYAKIIPNFAPVSLMI